MYDLYVCLTEIVYVMIEIYYDDRRKKGRKGKGKEKRKKERKYIKERKKEKGKGKGKEGKKECCMIIYDIGLDIKHGVCLC